MFHRSFFFGRLIILLLLIGGAMAVTRGAFRSGYEQGFVRGMAFSAVDGQTVDGQATPGRNAPESAARPPAGPWATGGFDRGWGHGGMWPFHGGGIMAFVIVVFAMMAIMKAIAWRHWAHSGPHDGWGHGRRGWGHHGHWGRHGRHDPTDDIGPEKQPEDFL